ncbi:rhodanese-like domain-containing protein [Rummeliibacillus sp. TYF-LIM-RU47]|uniref:rhodanese-like domain-containing protein n=1 Tax=Rummeliibacillus sp. TYF-LIM-RU47 TaxID=2608406 RepID=UPI00123915DA|nr:rhodanese-like domain-containing protein [Rummeliibacillus sp. TYF-LIM-RU47]
MKTITPEEVLNKLDANEDLHIVDVRENEEVANGIIPGASHIPLGQIPERMEELNKETPYIFVCHAGGRSFSACSYLEGLGYDVTNLEGGMSAWEGELEF